MLNTETELRQLDREFANSATMRPETFAERRQEILNRAAATPTPVAATPAPADPDAMPVTRGFFMRVLEPVVKSIARTFRSEAATLETRITALENRLAAMSNDAPLARYGRIMMNAAEPDALENMNARITALEQRPQMAYRGIWNEGDAYALGDTVTQSGSLWFAWKATQDRPGTSDAWQLCQKRSR